MKQNIQSLKMKRYWYFYLTAVILCCLTASVLIRHLHARRQKRLEVKNAELRVAEANLKQQREKDEAREMADKRARAEDQRALDLEKRIAQEREESQRLRIAEKQKAVRDFKEKHLGRNLSHSAVAVCIVDENDRLNALLGTTLSDGLRNQGLDTASDLFTSNFASDGLFQRMFDGSKREAESLDLNALVDVVVLGKQSVQFTRNSELGVETAAMIVTIKTVHLNSSGQPYATRLETVGVDTASREKARAMAEDRMIQALGKTYESLINHLKAK